MMKPRNIAYLAALMASCSVMSFNQAASAAGFTEGDISITLGTAGVAPAGATSLGIENQTPTSVGGANYSQSATGTLSLNGATLSMAGAQIVQGNGSGDYATPFTSTGSAVTTPYLAVYGGGTATFTLSQPATYFGLNWGSVDTVNTLTFENAQGTVLGVVTGAELLAADSQLSNGSQLVDGAIFANLSSSTPFTTVIASSGQNSFEFNAVSTSPVPLPAALPLFFTAIASLGAVGRRRRKAAAAAA